MSTMPETPLDQPVGEMTNATKRGRIAKIVGTKTDWDTPLDKRTLNSVYAYLTGGFAVPRRAMFKPDHGKFADRKELLVGVVYAAGIGQPEDSWSPVVKESPDELRSDELEELIERLKEKGDQRDWTPDTD